MFLLTSVNNITLFAVSLSSSITYVNLLYGVFSLHYYWNWYGYYYQNWNWYKKTWRVKYYSTFHIINCKMYEYKGMWIGITFYHLITKWYMWVQWRHFINSKY